MSKQSIKPQPETKKRRTFIIAGLPPLICLMPEHKKESSEAAGHKDRLFAL
ncbi:MAG TPA: hypothetical protein VJY15_06730 [Candidatus Acidoferrum sp.]|nr:hypothetical protein [Candidatus Acidoferrum sp.]